MNHALFSLSFHSPSSIQYNTILYIVYQILSSSYSIRSIEHFSTLYLNNMSQTTTTTSPSNPPPQPRTISDYDNRENSAWMYSFGATMVPFLAFCYGHKRGVTVKVVDSILKSRVGGVGLLALPFVTLAMEKCVYDSVQAFQGIDPNVRPADRGGFPSGGAALPSFSLIAVKRRRNDEITK
jgi:hypothetical protein